MQILQLLPEWSRKLWSEWHARVLVLLSLTLQIVLVFLGSRRKRSGKLWIRIVVWSAYLAADSVAMLAIGVISSNLEDIYDKSGKIDENVELVTFWAPFLLLHLGGPDTITAYALEDNELWLRHLLGVVAQTGLTVYLLLMAWTGSHLSILAIFVTVAGMVKYCERTWVLWRASGENSMGFTPEFTEFITKNDGNNVVVISEENVFHLAYMLMKNFMIVTADYPRLLDQSFKVLVGKLLDDSSPKMCFKLIEVELGFLYDMLYTKAKLVHTGWGIGLRLVSFSVTSLVLVFFALAAAHKHAYSKIDLAITFVLLVGAIILEVYASGSAVISSDWTRAWTQSTQTCGPAVGSFQKPCLNVIGDSRWKESVSQFSILGFPFREKHVLCKGKVFDSYFPEVYQNLEHRKSITYTEVTDILKERIVIQVRNEKPQLHERSLNREMRAYRKYDLQSIIPYAGGKLKGLRENIMKWHIATEICYHLEDVDCINSANVEAYKYHNISCPL